MYVHGTHAHSITTYLQEGFLEYLNNVLSSGVVSNLFARDEMDEIRHNARGENVESNLFARDEMDEILNELVPVMKKEYPRRPPSIENLNEYFLSRTRQNLHVVLCFSPVSYLTLSVLFFLLIRSFFWRT